MPQSDSTSNRGLHAHNTHKYAIKAYACSYREVSYIALTDLQSMLCMGLLWGRPPQDKILKNHPSEIESGTIL